MTRLRLLSILPLVLMSVVLLIAGGGCEAIVNGNVQSFRCDGTVDAGICPSGQRCVAGSCVDCIEGNCALNDCESIDKDHDGYALCGHPNDAGTAQVEADCDDNDPDVHPGAALKCNGKDNNCDGQIDNPCPTGQSCQPDLQTCSPNDKLCTPGSCTPPQQCDPGTKTCQVPNATPLGKECTANTACEKGAFCGNAAVLTNDVVNLHNPPSLCTKACCTSTDCPTGFVCFGAGTGGNYCVSGTDLSRLSLGTTAGGASCSVDGDCRSGVCTSGRCQDTCCGSSQCAQGTTCRAMDLRAKGTATKHVLGCDVPPSGGAAGGDACEVPKTCLLCFGNYPACTEGVCDNNGDLCHPACCSSSACSSHACGNNVPQSDHSTVVTTCSAGSQTPGPKQLGDRCTSDTDCAANLCIHDASGQYCSDTCCTDSDCQAAGLVCRPYNISGSTYYLRCVAPPMAAIK